MEGYALSNYSAITKHPETGKLEMADWLDDSFGRHVYGVRFYGNPTIYPGKDCQELGQWEILDEIKRLRGEKTDD